MTKNEVLQALTECRKIQTRDGRTTIYIDDRHFCIEDETGDVGSQYFDLSNFVLLKEVNPEDVGTWEWAGWEYTKGRSVTRAGRRRENTYKPDLNGPWAGRLFSGADVRATDWELYEGNY